jgi:hypothetical protein
MINKLKGPISFFVVALLIIIGPLVIFSDSSFADSSVLPFYPRTLEPIPTDLDGKAKTVFSSESGMSNAIYPNSHTDLKSSNLGHNVGDKASYYVSYWGKWVYNETDPSEFMTFTKRGESANCEIWVADDLT